MRLHGRDGARSGPRPGARCVSAGRWCPDWFWVELYELPLIGASSDERRTARCNPLPRHRAGLSFDTIQHGYTVLWRRTMYRVYLLPEWREFGIDYRPTIKGKTRRTSFGSCARGASAWATPSRASTSSTRAVARAPTTASSSRRCSPTPPVATSICCSFGRSTASAAKGWPPWLCRAHALHHQ